MKKIIIFTALLLALTSCKKTYNCVCIGHSAQSLLFSEQKPVTATSKKKADDACIRKFLEYEDQYKDSTAKIPIIRCDLK